MFRVSYRGVVHVLAIPRPQRNTLSVMVEQVKFDFLASFCEGSCPKCFLSVFLQACYKLLSAVGGALASNIPQKVNPEPESLVT